jgi:Sec-independent protein translocase protein TatA
MDFLGIGGWELMTLLVIMLIVAGPKRMIQWAYIAGTYAAKLRAIWAETMKVVQKELKASGVDVNLPKDLPTSRQALRKQINNTLKPITNPLKETMDEVNTGLNVSTPQPKPVKTSIQSKSNGTSDKTASSDDSGFGTWSNGGNAGN